MDYHRDFYEEFDLESEAEQATQQEASYEPVTEGEHYATIIETTEIIAKTGNIGLRVKFACLEETDAGDIVRSMTHTFWLSDKARKNGLIPLCRATFGTEGKFHPNRLLNHQLKIMVKHPDDDNGFGNDNGAIYPEISMWTWDIFHGMMSIQPSEVEAINKRFMDAGLKEVASEEPPTSAPMIPTNEPAPDNINDIPF